MIKDIEQMASNLRAGGWRSADKEALRVEYEFTEAEADMLEAICDKLAEYEAVEEEVE